MRIESRAVSVQLCPFAMDKNNLNAMMFEMSGTSDGVKCFMEWSGVFRVVEWRFFSVKKQLAF